jgi:hypothetical protein
MVLAATLARRWQEATLDLAAFLFIPVLTLAPRGIPLVVAVSGIVAAALVWSRGSPLLASLRMPTILVGLVAAFGAVSAIWAIDPLRSLMIAARLVGIFAAGLSLAAAAPLVDPRRLLMFLAAGILVGVPLAIVELATGGAVSGLVFARPFAEARMNFASMTLTILLFPLVAAGLREWRHAVIAIGVAMAGTIWILSDTTAKGALLIGVGAGALFYVGPRVLPRLAAVLSILVVLTAPVTFPRIERSRPLGEAIAALKASAAHRLLIWSFAGDRIAEQPLLGWGLDSSRAIPGGSTGLPGSLLQPLPVHPHNASLQVWLELGLPGATLFALLIAFLFVALGRSGWPRAFFAASGASMTIALAPAFNSWSLWNETWQGMLWFSAFLVLALSRPDDHGDRLRQTS